MTPSIPLSKNNHLLKWVDKMARLTQPAGVHWVDGSQEEYDTLCIRMVERGTFIKLNEELWPGCYLARSNPGDVARVEDRTFICSYSKEAAGPTNNWEDPFQMRRKLKELFGGSMRGRTMYVLPFSMGPIGSPMSRIGVQLTDSPYVVVSMRIMARIGLPVYAEIDKGEKRVVPCMHSVGAPLAPGRRRRALAVQRREVHRPFSRDPRNLVVRFRLRRQCASGQEMLRPADRLQHRARRGLAGRAHAHSRRRRPARREDLCHRCFSLGVRQDELRHDDPPRGLRGVEGVDRRRRHRLAQARRVKTDCGRSIPRAASSASRQARRGKPTRTRWPTLSREHDLHERRTHARRGRVVGGHDGRAAAGVHRLAGEALDATDRARDGGKGRPSQLAVHGPRLAMPDHRPGLGRSPRGYRSARSSSAAAAPRTMPLVHQAFNWSAGVYIGATLGSEMTAAAAGVVGKVRRDPMAMLPFCGYHMGDYFRHWIRMQRALSATPRIFHVNWFRKDADGSSSGRGSARTCECSKWIIDRARGRTVGKETPIGWMPRHEDIEWRGLDFPKEKFEQLQVFNREAWQAEVLGHEELFIELHDRLPPEMVYERELLICRI